MKADVKVQRKYKAALYVCTFLTVFMPLGNAVNSTPTPKSLKIAVIDTGIDTNHENLRENLWRNPGETGRDQQGNPRETNGVDDDGNGFIDDVYGWNFSGDNANLADKDGHGTHISGTIKKFALQSSPDPRFELMTLKYYEASMSKAEQRKAFVKALKYAVQMKADVINISAGGPTLNDEEQEVLTQASLAGIVVIAAAGNKKAGEGNKKFFPAAYDIPHLLSVAALGANGKVLPTSNLNADRKNLFVLGEKIEAALPGNRYGKKTGSSQAAAALTGKLVGRAQRQEFSQLYQVAETFTGELEIVVSESAKNPNEI